MFVGHKTQWELLKKVVAGSRVPQAFIFSGEEALGKRTVAFGFIKLLNGKEMPYPDLILIEPQEKATTSRSTARREIHISQIRDLQKSLSLKPQFSSFKAVIIDEAERLNIQAQNCLLKTLEEPKGRTLFILITAHPEMLSGTIRSRCEILKFYPVTKKEMEKHFKPEIIALAEGRPGKAFNFLKEPELLLFENEATKEIQQLLKKSLQERFTFAEDFTKENNAQDLQRFLERLVKYLRSLLFQRLETGKELGEKIEMIESLKFQLLTSNINQRLALETLMLKL